MNAIVGWIPQVVMFLFMLLMGATAVYGLYWAAKHEQFNKIEDSSKMIFDEDEKIGKVTDTFPSSVKGKKTN